MIRGTLVLIATAIYLVIAAVIGIPHVWLTGRLEFIYAEARFGVRWLFRLAGIKLIEHGRENLAGAGSAAIYMSNHQSNLDPPALFLGLPGLMTILVKRELFSIPVLGMVMRTGGLIPVDRGDRDSAIASVNRAAEIVAIGRPLLVFPEGTRSPDGKLLPFKKGPFILAEKAGARIWPVTISGTRNLMPKGSLRLCPGTIELFYHPPIAPARDENERERVMERARQLVAGPLQSA